MIEACDLADGRQHGGRHADEPGGGRKVAGGGNESGVGDARLEDGI